MFVTSPSTDKAVGVGQCLSPTDSVFESQTKLAVVFNLAPIECEAVVVSAGEILDSASPNGTRVEP
jgi:hypothetical protein